MRRMGLILGILLLSVAAFAATGDCSLAFADYGDDLGDPAELPAKASWVAYNDLGVDVDLGSLTPYYQPGAELNQAGTRYIGLVAVTSNYLNSAATASKITYVNVAVSSSGEMVAWLCAAHSPSEFIKYTNGYYAIPSSTIVEQALVGLGSGQTVSNGAISSVYVAGNTGLYNYANTGLTSVRVFGRYGTIVSWLITPYYYTVPTGTTVTTAYAHYAKQPGSGTQYLYVTEGGAGQVTAGPGVSGSQYYYVVDNFEQYMDTPDASCKVQQYCGFSNCKAGSVVIVFEG